MSALGRNRHKRFSISAPKLPFALSNNISRFGLRERVQESRFMYTVGQSNIGTFTDS